jgi:tetratricopeptide (TPR) repeat protein/predicted Ser/Thr protein kinase
MDTAPPERWHEIEGLFAMVVELDAEERRAFLSGRDLSEGTRRDLERLLDAHDRSTGFLESLDGERAGLLVRSPDETFEAGHRIGHYRVVRELGSGGMGVVLLAHDPRLDRQVALKLLPHDARARRPPDDHLVREARAASRLDHPNVVTIYDIGQTDEGRRFIAMAYHEGPTLRERLADGPLPIVEVLDVIGQMARGLRAAHARGIVHGDIKPGNAILAPDGVVKIVDFGIATMAGDRSAIGTWAYMSPEQAAGEEVDGRADLWALGVVMYEALTGVRPFDAGPSPAPRCLSEDPPPLRDLRPDVPGEVESIVLRCLAKPVSERFPDADALLAAVEATRRTLGRRARAWSARAGLAGAGLLALILAGGALLVRDRTPPSIAPGAGVLVAPFVPATPDTTLERLGQDLAITVAASLDGTAGLRAVEPITLLGQPEMEGPAPSETTLAEVARRLGATTLVRGTLARSGSVIHAEAALLASGESGVWARVSASAPVGELGELTDSLALALLRHLASGEEIQAPNLAAITTSSVDALRHYLAGERAVARGQFREAPQHFARAIEADSTFWFAYWRYAYARGYHGESVDSAVAAVVIEHRRSFPEQDRRLVEAGMPVGRRERVARLEEVTRLFPTYWPAWFQLGDVLTHHGPYLGLPAGRARSALERTIALNPGFVPAWEHLFWIANDERDLATSERILSALTAIRLDTLRQSEWNLDTLEFYRCLDVLARSGGLFDAECLASGVDDLTGYRGPMEAERLALSTMRMGHPRGAAQLADSVRARPLPPEVMAAQWWASAIAEAGRGDGASALEAAARYARTAPHADGPLWAYGLAVVSAWLGIADPAAAADLRDAALSARAPATEGALAELDWLDGVLALTRGDSLGVIRAVDALRERSIDPPLLSSLEALALADRGDREASGRALAALEWELADQSWHYSFGRHHPFLNGVNRLAAGRSLLAAGDPAEAARLLAWHEANLPGSLHPLPAINALVGTLALFEQGRAEERRGRPELAMRYYRTFLERYDRPPRGHTWMVDLARTHSDRR